MKFQKLEGDPMTRVEKIEFCRESVKKTNSNPYVRFEELDEIKLDAWVRYFECLTKQYDGS